MGLCLSVRCSISLCLQARCVYPSYWVFHIFVVQVMRYIMCFEEHLKQFPRRIIKVFSLLSDLLF